MAPTSVRNSPWIRATSPNAEEMEKLSDADIKNVILDGGPSAQQVAHDAALGQDAER